MPIENGRLVPPRISPARTASKFNTAAFVQRSEKTRENATKARIDAENRLWGSPKSDPVKAPNEPVKWSDFDPNRTPSGEKVSSRFIAVKQPSGETRLQDLNRPGELMSTQDITNQGEEIGKQAQTQLSVGRKFRTAQKERDIEALTPNQREQMSAQLSKWNEQDKQKSIERTAERSRATTGTGFGTGTSFDPRNVRPDVANLAVDLQAKRRADQSAFLSGESSTPKTAMSPDLENRVMNTPIQSSSQSRTSAVLRQSERAEQLAQQSKDQYRRLTNKPKLFGEGVEYYKNILTENKWRQAGQFVGQKWNKIKGAFDSAKTWVKANPKKSIAIGVGGVALGGYAMSGGEDTDQGFDSSSDSRRKTRRTTPTIITDREPAGRPNPQAAHYGRRMQYGIGMEEPRSQYDLDRIRAADEDIISATAADRGNLEYQSRAQQLAGRIDRGYAGTQKTPFTDPNAFNKELEKAKANTAQMRAEMEAEEQYNRGERTGIIGPTDIEIVRGEHGDFGSREATRAARMAAADRIMADIQRKAEEKKKKETPIPTSTPAGM